MTEAASAVFLCIAVPEPQVSVCIILADIFKLACSLAEAARYGVTLLLVNLPTSVNEKPSRQAADNKMCPIARGTIPLCNSIYRTNMVDGEQFVDCW